MVTGTTSSPSRNAGRAGDRPSRRSDSAPLQTRKLRTLPCFVHDTSSLPVNRHQAGKSASTEISVERNSSSPPRTSGSMCCRISSSSPLPQSRSPPSKLASGSRRCRSTGSTRGSLIADAGAPVRQELHQLCAADDCRAGHQTILVELALLEAGGADVDGAAALGEVLHQFPQWCEPLFADVVGVAGLGQADALAYPSRARRWRPRTPRSPCRCCPSRA